MSFLSQVLTIANSIKISVPYLVDKADKKHSTVSTPPIAYSTKKSTDKALNTLFFLTFSVFYSLI